jgi:transcriptional regulator with XRE-family HTH domain
MSTETNAQRIGTRLRRIRHQQGLSLADVEEQSEGTWKAVVVGAYERGDRAVSVARLAALAEFYGVPLADILPGAEVEAQTDGSRRVVLDLTALSTTDTEEVATVARFAQQVQRRRGDHNGRMLSLRGDDLELLALAVGTSSEDLLTALHAQGAVLPARTDA